MKLYPLVTYFCTLNFQKLMKDCISQHVILNDRIFEKTKVINNLITGNLVLYEVIRIIDGIPLFINDHLDRLFSSAILLKVDIWITKEDILKKIETFINHESIKNGNIRISCTFSENEKQILLYQSRHSYPTEEMYNNGVETKTIHIERENPNAKNIQLFHTLIQDFFAQNNIYEAILVDKNECVTEGSKSNIFFIKDQSLITARIEDVLPGITRKYVFQAAINLKIKIEERKIYFDELSNFDVAFISGTSPKILPIKLIDNMSFETNNVVLLQLMSELNRIIADNIKLYKRHIF